ncbi:MAG TPA: methyl-accepting chemotaxis protein, partial [Vicinamibacteria bacterium]
GIGQLSKGMMKVDQVTQRNAAAAEELAATAEELAGQAASQRDLVAFFKLDGALLGSEAVPTPLPSAAELAAAPARPLPGRNLEPTSDGDFRPF